MRSSFFILVAPLAGTMVSAGCFKNGQKGNKQTAIDNIDSSCKSMQGSFVSKGHRNLCVFATGDTSSWYLEVERSGETGGTLNLAACKKGLTREVNGCDKGGRREDDGWTFTADPDDGLCMDINYINENSPKRAKRSISPSEENYTVVFDVPQPNPEVQSKKEETKKRHISFEA